LCRFAGCQGLTNAHIDLSNAQNFIKLKKLSILLTSLYKDYDLLQFNLRFSFIQFSAPTTIPILALPRAGLTSFNFNGAVPRPFLFRKNSIPLPSPTAPSDGSTHWHQRALVHKLFRNPSEPPSTLAR